MKYLKIVIICVIIIIIILIVYLLNIKKDNSNTISNNLLKNTINSISSNKINNINNSIKNNNVNNNSEISIEERENYGDKMNITSKINNVTSANMFYTIENAIQSYINNITSGNSEAVYNQLSTSYIKNNNIDTLNVLNYVENISGNQEFRAIKMNYVAGEIYNQYSVYGKLLNSNGNTSELYVIININTGNLTYSIIPQLNTQYTSISQVKIQITKEEIIENLYNKATYKKMNDEDIVNGIIKDYQRNALYDTENAYKLIDYEYRKKRFKNYNDYFKYVQTKANEINSLKLVRYKKKENTDNIEYECEDNYGNIYKIKSTGIREYNIILDNYTLQNNSYKSDYASLENKEKAKENVNKFIKMINTCDYTNCYNLLYYNFRNNYFNTQDEFENYIKQNFYKYNIIKSIDITEREDDVYICVVELKDRVAVAANTMTKTIIMKLGEETDFEMSFDI